MLDSSFGFVQDDMMWLRILVSFGCPDGASGAMRARAVSVEDR
jgi:hypothetical protein